MVRYSLKRLGLAIPTLFGASILVFLLLHFIPGDPIDTLVPVDATEEERQAMMELMGLNRPLPEQFWIWLTNALRGDLGTSFSMRAPVNELLGQALLNSLGLAIAAGVFGCVAGGLLGTVAALRRGGWVDKLVSAIGLAGISVPAFWFAFLLIVVFAIQLGWLPSGGMRPIGGGSRLEELKHMIMPALAIGISTVGMLARIVRANMIQVLNEEFVVTLRAKGMGKANVLAHIFRNVAPPVLTVMGLEIGSLLSGSVLVETIFNWPGIGGLLNGGIASRDIQLIQGGILMIAVIFVLVNLLVDLIHTAVDPRIQRR